MDQKKLWGDLSKNILAQLYLLFGEEEYLVQFYAKAIEDAAQKSQDMPLYKDVFEGNRPASDIILAASTVPFFPGKRLILVKDSKLFAAGRKVDSEAMADFLQAIPDDTVIVFMESDVDRRLKLYKKAQEVGNVINNERQTTAALVKWLTRQAKQKGLNLPAPVANLIISTCGTGMTNLFFEMEKLTSYAAGTKSITAEDVAEICTPNLEARIFGLTKSVGAGDVREALGHYGNLIKLKESPIMILTMIIRQIRLILLCKLGFELNIPRSKIASDLKIRDFVVSEVSAHGRRFTKEKLLWLLQDCLDTDVKIKTGLLSDEIGVEMLLLRAAEKRHGGRNFL